MATPNLLGITSVTPGILAATQTPSGATAIYTVPANKAAKLGSVVITNTSGAAVTISVSVVPSGGSVDGTHLVLFNYSLAAGASIVVDEINGMWIGDGDKVVISAGAATAIDAVLTGLVFA